MALTEDDVRRIVREEIERSRVVPVHTTPQPPDFMAPCPARLQADDGLHVGELPEADPDHMTPIPRRRALLGLVT